MTIHCTEHIRDPTCGTIPLSCERKQLRGLRMCKEGFRWAVTLFLPKKWNHSKQLHLQSFPSTYVTMLFRSVTPRSWFQMGGRSETGPGWIHPVFVWETEVKIHWIVHHLFHGWCSPLAIPHVHEVWVDRIMPRSVLRIRIKQASVSLKFHLTHI